MKAFALNIFCIMPIRDVIVFESNPDFFDESFFLCEFFIKKGLDKKYQFYWLRKNRDKTIVPTGWNIREIYQKSKNLSEWIEKQVVIHTAKCILDGCYFIPKTRSRQFRIFLHHGMPIKRIDRYMERLGKLDYISIGSNFFRNYYRTLGINDKQMVCFGMARNDALCKNSGQLRKMLEIGTKTKIVIWMPTYRQHEFSNEGSNIPKDQKNETGMPVLKEKQDWDLVNKKLKEWDTILLLRIHPSQNRNIVSLEEHSHIYLLTDEFLQSNKFPLYQVLGETDALITDYSSVYIDYLLTDRPIGLTVDDLKVYEKNVGFVFNYEENIKGFYIRNTEQFLTFIEKVVQDDLELMELLKGQKERFHTIQDYSSIEKLGEFIIRNAKL